MPRPLRMCEDGALYHVTCRGDNREPIFFDAKDYQQYLRVLHRYKKQFQFLLPCYCLMPNHVHLVIQASALATISTTMLCISTRYTQYFNKRHGRVGHVFQGRFHSKAIEQDQYLLVLSRYVHLNPVKAKLCAQPEVYPWSSYRAYFDRTVDSLGLVDPDLVLGLMSVQQEEERPQRYREFIDLPIDVPVPVTF